MAEYKSETIDEKIYRRSILSNNTRKTIPIALLVLLLIIGVGAFILVENTKIKDYGVGNPYECIKCSEAKMACKEHRGFDQNRALEEKIKQMSLEFIPEGYNANWSYYGGLDYNGNCDFCKDNGIECYSCEYNRLALTNMAEKVSSQEEFKDKLCDKCWNLGYAQCTQCRDLLYNEIIKMKGEGK